MGCSSSTAKSVDVVPPPADAFLPHYTLAALGTRDVFGPFLKLRNYDPNTGSYDLSVLVVCTKAVRQQLQEEPVVRWSEKAQNDGGIFDFNGERNAVDVSEQVTAPGELLYSWRDWQFLRFHIGTTCEEEPKQLHYQVNLVSELSGTVSVPSRGQTWNWAFCTCNGLDDLAKKDVTGGLQPMWNDLLARHADRPLHALVGGGDQIYNDGVFEGPLLQGWDESLSKAETEAKVDLPFSDAMRDEVEAFYFAHYCVHYSQPVYRVALASIPSINVWDDHDIFDGWGSYPEHITKAPVLQGVFSAAQLFYLLFQQHTTSQLAASDGFWSGTSSITRFGDSTAVVLPDPRTFRTLNQICPPDFYDELRSRLEDLPESVRHVVLVLTVPILWPMLDIAKILRKLSDKVTKDRAINELMGSTGLLRQLPLRFGEIELLDDLVDHWDSRQHIREREAFLETMMDLAATKGFRVSLLSGDVHCAGYGMFHSRGDLGEDEVEDMRVPDQDTLAADPRFMPQIVSSAITNVPPPKYVLDALAEARRQPKAVLQNCVARMVPLERRFDLGIEERSNEPVGGRNWCEVTQAGPDGNMVFDIRCEKELGTGKVRVFTIEVPPLQR